MRKKLKLNKFKTDYPVAFERHREKFSRLSDVKSEKKDKYVSKGYSTLIVFEADEWLEIDVEPGEEI